MAAERTKTSASDATAQRLLNLMFIFNTTDRPLSTDEIISDSDLGYGSDVRESDIRKFRRDRASLAERGIIIAEVSRAGASENEESLWRLDRDRTFAEFGVITPDDAEALAAAIDEYLAGPATPLVKPLESVRRKTLEIAGGRGGSPAQDGERTRSNAGPGSAAQAVLDLVWAAFSLRRMLPFSYVNAVGAGSSRTVAIYGIFTHKGVTYITGHDTASNGVRTFRTDRMERVKRPRGTYSIPAGFSINDYLFMPFDFGDGEAVEALFTLPAARGADEVATITRNRGTLTRGADGTWLWAVTVRSLDAAASYALEHARDGMRVSRPRALVQAWTDGIRKAVGAHGEA